MKKRIVATFLIAVMVLIGFVSVPKSVNAGEGYVDQVDYVEKTADFKSMWKEDGSGKVPKQEGYVFGGWYVENEAGEKVALSTAEAKVVVEDETTSEVVYAKFVPEYVLSVKTQFEEGISYQDRAKASVRILSSVDSKEYQKVGFEVLVDNKHKVYTDSDNDGKVNDDLETTKVYSGLIVGTDTENPRIPQTVFGTQSSYISAWKLTGIADKYDARIIKITPYWITMDGTKVMGLAKYVHIEDGYKNYINVPVNLTSGEEIAAGQLKVNYDPTIVKLVQEKNAVEFDGVFATKEMIYSDDGKGTIRIVGNASKLGKNETADDIFANIRFEIIDEENFPGSASTEFLAFNVEEVIFCNWDEDLVDTNVWSIQH